MCFSSPLRIIPVSQLCIVVLFNRYGIFAQRLQITLTREIVNQATQGLSNQEDGVHRVPGPEPESGGEGCLVCVSNSDDGGMVEE